MKPGQKDNVYNWLVELVLHWLKHRSHGDILEKRSLQNPKRFCRANDQILIPLNGMDKYKMDNAQAYQDMEWLWRMNLSWYWRELYFWKLFKRTWNVELGGLSWYFHETRNPLRNRHCFVPLISAPELRRIHCAFGGNIRESAATSFLPFTQH